MWMNGFPQVYAVNPEATDDPFLFPATGLRVDAVSHDPVKRESSLLTTYWSEST